MRHSRVVFYSAAVVLLACHREVLMREAQAPSPAPSYPVDHSLRIPPADYVAGSRQAEADSALAKILARFGNDERARQQFLEMLDPRPTPLSADGVASWSWIGAVSNPEDARLLSTIYQIRYADIHARQRDESRELARRTPALVTVVLVESLPEPDIEALLLRGVRSREPCWSDGSRCSPDVVLLPNRSATAETLRRAFMPGPPPDCR